MRKKFLLRHKVRRIIATGTASAFGVACIVVILVLAFSDGTGWLQEELPITADNAWVGAARALVYSIGVVVVCFLPLAIMMAIGSFFLHTKEFSGIYGLRDRYPWYNEKLMKHTDTIVNLTSRLTARFRRCH